MGVTWVIGIRDECYGSMLGILYFSGVRASHNIAWYRIGVQGLGLGLRLDGGPSRGSRRFVLKLHRVQPLKQTLVPCTPELLNFSWKHQQEDGLD